MNTNLMMPLKVNLRTLAPNYSTVGEIYNDKRIFNFDKNNKLVIEEIVEPEDTMKEYKKLMSAALKSSNIINIHIPLEYNAGLNNLSAYITEICASTNLELENMVLLNIETKTTIPSPEGTTYTYNKQNGTLTITIPNFNNQTTIVNVTLLAIIDSTLTVNCSLRYNPIF